MNCKKTTALVTSALIAISIFAGCNQSKPKAVDPTGNNPYAEHFSYEVLTIDDLQHMDQIPMLQAAQKKFNIDVKQLLVPWDGWDTKVRMLAASQSLPDVLVWYNLNYAEYENWSKQGLFHAIPDFSKYPNIAKINEGYKVFDKLKVDGKLYAVPKVIKNNPYNEIQPSEFIYRRDWAKAMGYDWKASQDVTWDEFLKYLQDVKTKDPGKQKQNLIPLDIDNGVGNLSSLISIFNKDYGKYVKKDGKYVYGSLDPSSITGLKALNQLYNEGILAKDIYSYKNGNGYDRFSSGRTAVLMGNNNLTVFQSTTNEMKASSVIKTEEDLGYLTVKAPDGTYHKQEKAEWWGAYAFSSKLDDKKVDRWMQFANYALTKDNLEVAAYGTKGTDWTKDSAGKINLNWPKDAKGNYSFTKENGKEYIDWNRTVQKWFVLEGFDVFLPGNPQYGDYAKSAFKDTVEREKTKLTLSPNNYDIDYFSSPNKTKYGTFGDDFLTLQSKALVSKDPEKEWNSGISSLKDKIDSVTQELNSGIK